MTISRRIFLITGSAAGAGLVLGIAGCAPNAAPPLDELNMWIAIAPDGVTTIRVNASDIGQGAQTGLAQIVADELDADWTKVRVEMAPVTDRYMIKDGNGYYTGGSSSIHGQYDMFAKAGATARHLLVAAAAQHWGVDRDACWTENGFVWHPNNKLKRSYGSLVPKAVHMAMPNEVDLKERKDRKLIGKPIPRLDIPPKVNGETIYGIDVKVPGMLVATLAQCPYFGGTLVKVDEKPALAVKGVKQVVTFDNVVVVAGTSFHAAKKGLDALDIQWAKPADAMATQDAVTNTLRQNIGAADSMVVTLPGKDKAKAVAAVNAAMAGGAKIYEAEYQVQLLSHSPMEPMNATAHVTPTSCAIWVSTQVPGDMRDALVKTLALPKTAVTVHLTQVGGGFGRRLETDYGVLAAKASRALGHVPVKLIWSREEDMTHDAYRPTSLCKLRAALNDDKTIRALDYTGATSNDTALGGIAWNYPYGDVVLRQKKTTLQFPIGSWRSVDPGITIFFIESLVDEIAHGEGLDPLAYRRTLLAKDARGLRVLNAAALMAGWGNAPSGHSQGIAFFNQHSWGTAVAHVIELSVDRQNRITVHKVCCAIDPGIAVNPGQIKAQAEGGIIMGLSAALAEQITLKDGAVEQKNFDTYPVLRLKNIPEIEVLVMETEGAEAGGVGEPPVPPVAPALANAMLAATGKRVRALPFVNSGFTV
ncbi:MAG TPA: molybdopterin cofactor-binding domain-containing protein [Rhizomicrobium sp.]|nr:molybdopterin cofactor-binding domain-containing protein [Rhizomicrobium sp.]